MASENSARERSIKFGKWLANAPDEDKVVISGMSGRFPSADNVYEFRDKLFDKVDLITKQNRWESNRQDGTEWGGFMHDIGKFDAGHFGIHKRLAKVMDPQHQMVLEKTVEAVMDAGLAPNELEGSKTDVYLSISVVDAEEHLFFRVREPHVSQILGSLKSTLANRISHFFKVKGVSVNMDTACSSSMYSLDQAYKAIRKGQSDNAIIVSINAITNLGTTLQFMSLGVLSPHGRCKSFDNSGDGYVRSEAVAVLVLQKAKNARRIYAEVVHSKTNCDGYKDEGITFPSRHMQKALMEEFYEETGIEKKAISFIEAHATGTKAGDPEELAAIDAVLSPFRKGPLLIGSVKSNMGHSEPASALCSIIKVLLGLETGYIPPNINFTKPRSLDCLLKKRFEVVTEKRPWPTQNDILVGVNSFGFGGSNGHILLRSHDKIKNKQTNVTTSRLLCISGRTEQSVAAIFDDLLLKNSDEEFIALLNQTFKNDIHTHRYRGYIIVEGNKEIFRSIDYLYKEKGPLYILFNTLDKNQLSLRDDLMSIPLFSTSYQRIEEILKTLSVNNIPTDLIQTTVTLFAISVVLKTLNICPDRTIGFSVGEFAKAYFDDLLTLEEAVTSAYSYISGFNSSSKSLNRKVLQQNGKNNIINGTETVFFKDTEILKQFKTTFRKHNGKSEKNILLNGVDHFCGTPEYFTKKIPECSNGIIDNLPDNTTVLEIGHFLNYSKINNGSINILNLDNTSKGINPLLNILGRLYNAGHNPEIDKLYPPVEFPVSRGTPMISPLIKWDHSTCYETYLNKTENKDVTCRTFDISIASNKEWEYITGHVIDGRNLFPATGYLHLVWETITGSEHFTGAKVTFEDVKFHQAVSITKQNNIQLLIMIRKGDGYFEITNNEDALIVSGKVFKSIGDANVGKSLFKYNFNKKQSLLEKDVYKELRLRGYHYNGLFKAIKQYNFKSALVQWHENFVAFMDNMLQVQIMQLDSRSLYVPTAIENLIIDGPHHYQFLSQFEEEYPLLPVYINPITNTICCGGITIKGTKANSIPRRKTLADPVLEKYVFVANETALSLEQSVRVNMQIIIENESVIKIKAAELFDESGKDPLGPIIGDALGDLPLIQSEIIVLSKQPLELQNCVVEDGKLATQTGCTLVVASEVIGNNQLYQDCLKASDAGYIISRENPKFESGNLDVQGLNILTVHTLQNEKLVLLCRKKETKIPTEIEIANSCTDFNWLSTLKKLVANNHDILLYAQPENGEINGILGLFNCFLQEYDKNRAKCVYICDNAPKFNQSDAFYNEQLEKNLVVNVFKDGKWGTYRHLLLDTDLKVETEHCYVNVTTTGDLSTMSWLEGPIKSDMDVPGSSALVHIYYASLNFRDIMNASGRLSADIVTKDRTKQECILGFEFAGRTTDGGRVVGMAVGKALSSIIIVDRYHLAKVPNEWSLEDAASTMVVYLTVLYALKMRTSIKKGESILIHAGSGGVGQAAISVALYHGLTVYTTVGTLEKREFIKKQFPTLTDDNIGNSRSTSFEKWIKKQTRGRGVDYVLNSLAEDKLAASVRCLVKHGDFLEIGKFDLANDNPLSTQMFRNGCSFHGVMLDTFMEREPNLKSQLMNLFKEGISKGYVIPLPRTVFKQNEVKDAFRYMAAGKHIGKVLIKVQDEEEEEETVQPIRKLIKGKPRYFCTSNNSYVITGGLGGFGLELADWLVLRGAQILVLNSRKGITTGYQASRINIWRKYGVKVIVSTADITTKQGCEKLLEEAIAQAPVTAIFNLAVVLKDATLENQTEENFRISLAPKALATQFLDEITRDKCPGLRDFVVFSSVSCGRGNAGQTNYGLANSIMERICEKRRKDGYPGLAIQWGAIGDVGLVAEMQEQHVALNIGGTLQQSITNCLQVMDQLLKQEEPIVSSMIVAEKKCSGGSIAERIAHILGIRDLKMANLHATFAELGMDSMTGVEIKQILERECAIFLSVKDMRNLTLAKLQELQKETDTEVTEEKSTQNVTMDVLLEDEKSFTESIVRLPSLVKEDSPASTVFLIPGVEGCASVLKNLALNLNAHVLCAQFRGANCGETIEEMAKHVYQNITKTAPEAEEYILIAHSYGCIIAVEVIALFEVAGGKVRAIFIDGSLEFALQMFRSYHEEVISSNQNPDLLESEFTIVNAVKLIFGDHYTGLYELKDKVFKGKDFKEKLAILLDDVLPTTRYSREFLEGVAYDYERKMKALLRYKQRTLINTSIYLYRASQVTFSGLSDNYGLSKVTTRPIRAALIEGNHTSILENIKLADEINCIILQNSTDFSEHGTKDKEKKLH